MVSLVTGVWLNSSGEPPVDQWVHAIESWAGTAPLSTGPTEQGERRWSHHNKGSGFNNPWPSFVDPGGPTIGRKILLRKIKGTENVPDTKAETVPVRKPVFLQERQPENESLRVTWLGHACVFAEFPTGLRVLFDPVFTPRCSPFSFMGPKRYTEQPCQVDDIPIVDVVVISHNHFDHLSEPTVKEIAKRHPNAQFFVPLGLASWFKSTGIPNVTELDWWESRDYVLGSKATSQTNGASSGNGAGTQTINATFGCLPSQHQTARSGFDRMSTLWASWSVSSGGKSLWFGGDTGYRTVPEASEGKDDYSGEFAHLPVCPAFSQIGQLRGPFDVGLVPIGAYAPRFIFSPIHANPEDAVNIMRDVNAKKALGIHWGTWILTEEDVLEPPRLVKAALKKKDMPLDRFEVCDIGESVDY
ncbi:hypothetical protein DOTSEDRAFT_88173 [Dothistroma septosporum NZE10]|uniref:Metallo-beta-lactamase domain-containing protein n=1 Tax=Dothistroma septosporum (strain NZE10 / CBS 128990) TaxID=675120 RepID=N1PLC0_DOTSN|nr:hypothetical protein DOTSEDRAFT_88173 [Dothistroma septosporum NZE10]